MFERFSDRARRVLSLAQDEARTLDHPFIGTEHILLGLLHAGSGVAAQALGRSGMTFDAARIEVRRTIVSSEPKASPPFTPRAKRVLELSLREALQLGHHYIGTEHILLGMLREGEGGAARVLRDLEVDVPQLRRQLIELIPSSDEGHGSFEEGVTAKARSGPLHVRLRPTRWWRVRKWRSMMAQHRGQKQTP